MLSEGSQGLKSIRFMILFMWNLEQVFLVYSVVKQSSGRLGLGQAVGRRIDVKVCDGIFCGDGNVLYFSCGGGYVGVCVCYQLFVYLKYTFQGKLYFDKIDLNFIISYLNVFSWYFYFLLERVGRLNMLCILLDFIIMNSFENIYYNF